MGARLEITSLVKHFDEVKAIDNISLTINPGEIFFLLGPSGCGKTTLLRSIAGFVEPSSGSIKLDGKELLTLPPNKRHTAMVFQSYALWPHLTVEENVAFGLEEMGIARQEIQSRVRDALDIVHITSHTKYKPGHLSGGQQQRVALARALVTHPACLLLDEPLSNLDAKLRLDMRTEIRRICKEAGLTAVYVTHDQKEALSIADRLAVLKDGKIAQLGKPSQVYLHPETEFVAGFMGEANFLKGTITQNATPNTLKIETEIGTIIAQAPETPPPQDVTICIRPEAISFTTAQSENAFDATIEETIFLGETVRSHITIGSTKLIATSLSIPNVSRITIDPTKVIILK